MWNDCRHFVLNYLIAPFSCGRMSVCTGWLVDAAKKHCRNELFDITNVLQAAYLTHWNILKSIIAELSFVLLKRTATNINKFAF